MHQMTKDNLLFHCLGIGADRIETDSFEHLSISDWNGVIQHADRQGVAPLLYQRLKAFGPDKAIPTSISQKLQEKYLHTALRNTYIYKELTKTLEILQNSGIPVVVLKGAALAELIYQDIALRPMHDVDLLVRGRDMLRIYRILSRAGFKFLYMDWANWVTLDEARYKNGSIILEVKSNMRDILKLNPWANISPVTIASTDTLILSPEVFMIHLCLHANRHYFSRQFPARLIWWFDIAELLKYYQEKFNWDYVIQIARQYKVEEAIHRVLHMAKEEFRVSIPTNVLSQLKDDGVTISGYGILHSSVTWKDEEITGWSQKSRRRIVFYILRRVFPCREYMVQRYSVKNPVRVYLYYPVRISEGVVKVAKKLLRSCVA